MPLSSYLPICDAIVRLLEPLAEVVIHDLASDTICYINGSLSQRKVGGPSLLAELEDGLDQIVYPKLNFDGRLVKSISIPLEDKWLLCINCDVSAFNQMKTLSELFLTHRDTHQPASFFKNDWQEKLHLTIHSFVQQNNWQFSSLTGQQKKVLVKHLFDCGAFHEKNAADYVAKVLHVGRATIFNYLKEWRNS